MFVRSNIRSNQL